MDWKDVATRAAWTFAQSFLAVYAAFEFTTVGDFVAPSLLNTAAVAGVAALLSFVKTIVAQQVAASG